MATQSGPVSPAGVIYCNNSLDSDDPDGVPKTQIQVFHIQLDSNFHSNNTKEYENSLVGGFTKRSLNETV